MSLVLQNNVGGGIFLVTLNRPEKRNALSIELREEIAATFHGLSNDGKCRAVILTGNGTAFCAGMDFTQFGGDGENKKRLVESSVNCFSSLLQFTKPLVCAINGPAVGGGFALSLCADARIASEEAYFGFFEVKRGIPAPYDIISLFVGESLAKDLCGKGRRFELSEALKCGLVRKAVRRGALTDECIKEAENILSAHTARMPISPELISAFEEEMRRFKNALLPE